MSRSTQIILGVLLLLAMAGCATPKPTDRTALAIDQAQDSAAKTGESIQQAKEHNAKAIAALERLRDEQARGAK